MSRRRSRWKEYRFNSRDDYRLIQSAWQSNHGAMGKDARMVFDGRDTLITNVSVANMRALARSDGAKLPDFLTAMPDDTERIMAGKSPFNDE